MVVNYWMKKAKEFQDNSLPNHCFGPCGPSTFSLPAVSFPPPDDLANFVDRTKHSRRPLPAAGSRPRPPPPLFHPQPLPAAVSSGPQKASERDEEPAPCDEAPAAAPAPDRRRDPRRLRYRRGAPPRLLRLLRQLHLHRLTPLVLYPGTGLQFHPIPCGPIAIANDLNFPV